MDYFPEGAWTDNTLTITTEMLQLKFYEGAIIYVKDINTDEVLLNVNPATDFPADDHARPWRGFGTEIIDVDITYCVPLNTSTPTFTRTSDNSGYVTYPQGNTKYGLTNNTSLKYTFTVNLFGEIKIDCIGTYAAATNTPYQITLSFLKFQGVNGVILSNGIWYENDVPTTVGEYPLFAEHPWYGGGIYPQVAAMQGTTAVLGIWSENLGYRPDWHTGSNAWYYGDVIALWHTQNSKDDISLIQAALPSERTAASSATITGGPWHIGTYSHWADVAKAWRRNYEDITGFYKLWESPYTYVPDIHCFYEGGINTNYSGIKAAVSPSNPERIMCLIWNGNNNTGTGDYDWIIWGDVRFPVGPHIPQSQIDASLAQSLPTMLYMPGQMIFDETGAANRLALLDSQGKLPANFVFTPAWNGGSLENWYATWTPVAPYYGDPADHVRFINPASSDFSDYMNKYVSDYIALHGGQGIYMDNAGQVYSEAIIDGKSHIKGESDSFKNLLANQPGVMMCTEYLNITNPTTFMWEGRGPGAPVAYEDDGILTHPFRTALVGSYVWGLDPYMLGVTISGYPHKIFGLGGHLPCAYLAGDYLMDSALSAYTIPRAIMFCKFELYNDLPTIWQDSVNGATTLNYLRSNTGNYFRYEDRGSDVYAYVEEHWQGDYDRLVIDTGVVTTDNIDEELPSILYSRYNYAVLPTDDADLTTVYTTEDIADVSADDTDMVAQLATSQIAIHQFKQQINGIGGIIAAVAQVTIPCSTSTTYLQIYNRSGTPAWDTIDSDNATGANTDFPLSATVADLTDYKDENNIVACRVYQEMQ